MKPLSLIKSRTKTFEGIGLGLGASLAMLVPLVGDWPVRLVVALCFAGTGWMTGLLFALLLPKRGTITTSNGRRPPSPTQ
jgi:hypothetical protein